MQTRKQILNFAREMEKVAQHDPRKIAPRSLIQEIWHIHTELGHLNGLLIEMSGNSVRDYILKTQQQQKVKNLTAEIAISLMKIARA